MSNIITILCPEKPRVTLNVGECFRLAESGTSHSSVYMLVVDDLLGSFFVLNVSTGCVWDKRITMEQRLKLNCLDNYVFVDIFESVLKVRGHVEKVKSINITRE